MVGEDHSILLIILMSPICKTIQIRTKCFFGLQGRVGGAVHRGAVPPTEVDLGEPAHQARLHPQPAGRRHGHGGKLQGQGEDKAGAGLHPLPAGRRQGHGGKLQGQSEDKTGRTTSTTCWT